MLALNGYWLHRKHDNEMSPLLTCHLARIKILLGDFFSQVLHPVLSRFHYFAQFQPRRDEKKKYPSFECRFCSCGKDATACHGSRYSYVKRPQKPALLVETCFKLFQEGHVDDW